MRPVLAAVAGALLLAGCPIPQAVPDYPPGSITPPRILIDQMQGSHLPVRFVPADCPVAPMVPLSASVLDTNTIETIEARWFVNYDPRYLFNRQPIQEDIVPPNPDPTVLTRPIPPTGQFQFEPYQHQSAPGTVQIPGGPLFPGPGALRVVELVVSNGFDPDAVNTTDAFPYRTTLGGFETQVFRWVFVSVSPAGPCPDGGTCSPAGTCPGGEPCCP